MDNKQSGLDFETMKGKALDQLRNGESLYGKDGAFALKSGKASLFFNSEFRGTDDEEDKW